RPDALTARAALRLATLGGAEALRLDAEIGSLEVGKQADLAVFAFDDRAGTAPDPVTALIFAPRSVRTRRVVVAGEELVRDGIVTAFDPAVPGRVAAASARLAQWRTARTAR